MPDPNQLQQQVAIQIDEALQRSISESFRPNESTFQTFQEKTASTPIKIPTQSTTWVRARIPYTAGMFVDLTRELFSYFANTVSYSSYESNLGRLVIDPVEVYSLENYTANLTKSANTSIPLNISWTQSIAIFVGTTKIMSSINSANTMTTVMLPLISGVNQVSILLYTSSANQKFDCGTTMRLFVDDWTTPATDIVAKPSGLTVGIDPSALGVRDANVNVLRWEPNVETNLGGYRIYRRGPYNAGA